MMLINDRPIPGEGRIPPWTSDKVEYLEYKTSITWGGTQRNNPCKMNALFGSKSGSTGNQLQLYSE